MIVAICGTCDGRKRLNRRPCPDCKGIGNVIATAARQTLIHDVLGAEIGSAAATAALDALVYHRTELIDWLIEAGIIGRTKYGLIKHQDHDGWGHRLPPETFVKTVDPEWTGRRLYTVNT